MTTVASIAADAFNGVGAAIDGVILTAVMEYETQGDYDRSTQLYITFTTSLTGRAVVGTASAIKASFPSYTVGPEDTLLLLEGFAEVPEAGWKVTAGGKTRIIKDVGDIAGAGTFFEVVAR